MKLPDAPFWPDEAVTFLIIGGNDYFRRREGELLSPEEYVADAKARVPAGNSTTALLFVSEMEHMPQSAVLHAVLQPAIAGLMAWQGSRKAPLDDFQLILASLTAGGFSGVLAYTKRKGDWQDFPFGAKKATPAAVPQESPRRPQQRSLS